MKEGFFVTELFLFLLIFWSNAQVKQDDLLVKDVHFQFKIILFPQREKSKHPNVVYMSIWVVL